MRKPTLIDTDIMLDILRGRNEQVRSNALRYLEVYPCYTISQITLAELAHGFFKREGSLASIERLLASVEVLPLTDRAAMLAGQISATLENAGLTIGIADTLIAAIAIDDDRVLVTANEKHFQRVVELGYPLPIENWRKEQIPFE